MIEEVDATSTAKGTAAKRRAQAVGSVLSTPLSDVQADQAQRIPTGMVELDRVLGGGLMPGSIVLVGGDPGMGKSQLLSAVATVAPR